MKEREKDRQKERRHATNKEHIENNDIHNYRKVGTKNDRKNIRKEHERTNNGQNERANERQK